MTSRTKFVSVSENITYSWKNINVWTQENSSEKNCFSFLRQDNRVPKQILKDVSGVVRPGELLAVMGASGAGKSTFFNVLTCRSKNLNVSAELLVNGFPMEPDSLAAISAYVQQDDLFIGSLTVREHLIFQSLLRMHRNIPYNDRIKRVEEVILEFGLSRCRDTKIGIPGRIKGISGGEMKRLSFASEILTDPQLMFCDEPTTGLDSQMAQTVVSVLRKLATQRGKSILCTIHQPSSQTFAMFDRILLLAEGRLAYVGDSVNAIQFFQDNGYLCPKNYNPAEFYIKTLAIQPENEEESKERVIKICNAFDTSDDKRNLETILNEQIVNVQPENQETNKILKSTSPYKALWLSQFRAVLWRSWISNLKDPFFLRIKILQTLIMSLCVGVIFFGQKFDQDGVQNINGAMFITLMNISFDNAYGTMGAFCLELPVFLREHFNGMYRTDVYFISKMMAEVPFYIIFPFCSASIVYFMVGLQLDVKIFFTTVGIYILVVNCSVSVGYMVSCIATRASVALSIAPTMMVPFVLFGGLFLNAGSVPVYLIWLKYLSWFYYGNEAVVITQWKDIDTIYCNRENSTCPENGAAVLRSLGFDEGNFWMDILALMGLVIIFRILAYLALLAKTFNRK